MKRFQFVLKFFLLKSRRFRQLKTVPKFTILQFLSEITAIYQKFPAVWFQLLLKPAKNYVQSVEIIVNRVETYKKSANRLKILTKWN